MTYARMGKRDDAMKVVRALEGYAKDHWVSPCVLAADYASLGNRDRAMAYLDDAFRKKDWVLRFRLNYNSAYLRPLRDDPRFIALRKQVLPTTWSD